MARTASRPGLSAAAPAVAVKPLVIAAGTLEGLKWLGLVLMLLDHANRFLFASRLPIVFEASRLVMPLFGFVLAYHLAQPSAMTSGVHVRVMKRLLLFGLLATPAFVALVGWWPLNILFTLLLAVVILYLADRGEPRHQVAAGVLFVAGGALVEYWWFALLCVLAAWGWCRQPTRLRLAAWILAVAVLGLVNGNLWALMAVPVVLLARYIMLPVPRCRWLFYAAYPVHLTMLWVGQWGLPAVQAG